MNCVRHLLTSACAFAASLAMASDLPTSFLTPPPSARPWALWYWMRGKIDRHGITEDLEAMRRAGVGGVVLGDILGATALDGPWVLEFPPGQGAPARVVLPQLISWTDAAEEGVKFFSGTASYRREFHVESALFGRGRRISLDLGRVECLAGVSINGRAVRTLWKEPYCVDITRFVRPGANTLEIAVTNTWVNRLIGDERQFPTDARWRPTERPQWGWKGEALQGLPEWFADWDRGQRARPTGRIAFSTVKAHSAADPLLPAGLLGPVRLLAERALVLPE